MSILLLGVIVGFQHALEADHVAAVSTIVAEESSARRILGHGVVWAIGHMLTITICIALVLLFGGAIDETYSHFMELAVGLMVCGLGLRLIYRQFRDGIRFSIHRHSDGLVHFHAHDAGAESQPAGGGHAGHGHKGHGSLTSLAIGMVHGMAGSAALLVLAVTATGSAVAAMGYVGSFAVGSILGMAMLTGLIALPLRSLNRMRWVPACMRVSMGLIAIAVGGSVVFEQWAMIV